MQRLFSSKSECDEILIPARDAGEKRVDAEKNKGQNFKSVSVSERR